MKKAFILVRVGIVFALVGILGAQGALIPPAFGFSTAGMVSGVAVGWRPLSEAMAKLPIQAGISWIRSDVSFDKNFQMTYSVAKKYSINLIGILDYNTLGKNSAFTVEDWKRVVTKAQQKYPLIRVWEIWNEPTLKKYQLGYMDGTPRHYFELLESAYEILKSNDPSAKVLGLGGAQLGHSKDLLFAQEVFSLGGGSYMDAISIHAYPYKLNIGVTWDSYKQLWTKELMQYGLLGKSFWVTETGLPSSQLNETDQLNYVVNSYSFFKGVGASAFIWFELFDNYGSNGALKSFGLLHTDMTAKPSYTAYGTLIT